MLTARFFIFNLAGHILPMPIALISVPVIAHYAGVERLGVLGVVWALVGYFGFLDFGLSRVVTRRVAQAAEQGRLDEELKVLRGFLYWRALPGLAAIALFLLLARSAFSAFLPSGALGQELTDGWAWIVWSVPATLMTNWLRGALEGVHRFARVNLLRSIFGAWTYAAPAIAAFYWPTLNAMIAAVVLGRVLAMLAHGWACFKAERGILLGAIPRKLSGLGLFFQEGGWITLSNLISPLMLYSDRFVLAALMSPRAVAWYITSQEVMLRTLVIPGALAGVLFPRFAGTSDSGTTSEPALLYQRAIRVVVALMLPLCVLLAAGAYDGLRLWLGESFALHGHRVVEIVALGVFVNAIAHMPYAWLQATGRSQGTAKIHLIELPLYAAGLYAGVTQWGIVGAASIWTLRLFLDCLLLLRLAGRESARVVALPFLSGIAAIVLAGALSGPERGMAWRAGMGIFLLLAVLVGVWFILLTQEDRRELGAELGALLAR